MFRSLSCSQSIRRRICRRTVTLYFNVHWNSQILVHIDYKANPTWSPFTTLQRSRLSSSEAWIQISVWLPIWATNPVVLFLETGSTAKSLSTKTGILWACSCLRNRSATGFPNPISRCTIQWNKVEFTRLAHSLDHMFRGFCKIQSVLGQAWKVSYKQMYLVASSVFRIGLRLPSNTSLSCSFSLVVFLLRIASLVIGGACLKSGSMSKYCPVWSVPTLNTRFNNKAFHVWIFESKCSHVFRCVFGFYKTVDVFPIIVWQTRKIVAVHRHSHFLIWIVKQCCAVFASSDQIHIIKLPDVGSVLSSKHDLDQSANFVFAIFLTILCGSRM